MINKAFFFFGFLLANAGREEEAKERKKERKKEREGSEKWKAERGERIYIVAGGGERESGEVKLLEEYQRKSIYIANVPWP